MNQHTPGPWVATSESTPGLWVIEALDRDGEHHRDICYMTLGGPSVCRANALLMAAAPEMLDMLVKLRDAGIWYSSALEIDVYGKDPLDGEELEAELKALIDKATGAAP